MPPRASLRAREATPARSTRATSTAQQDTPATATRRSTRAASRQPATTKNAVSNPALPEILIQQSYAYGSSKTPALPEQLRAKTLSMSAVAAHLNDAADEAERNLQAHAAEAQARDTSEVSPAPQTKKAQTRTRASQSRQPSEPSSVPPPGQTPAKAGKQSRVAAWVQSSSQLDDISEVDTDASPSQRSRSVDRESPAPSTERERTREESLPSSFPDGSFDHSYSYERGERGPRLPKPKSFLQQQVQEREHSRAQSRQQSQLPLNNHNQSQHNRAEPKKTEGNPSPNTVVPSPSIISRATTKIKITTKAIVTSLKHITDSIGHYILRLFQMMQRSILELPDTPVVSMLFKSLIILIMLGTLGLGFCYTFTYFCNPSSTSIISQTLQNLCGSCSHSYTSSSPQWNITDPTDISQLLSALQKTQSQIAQVESRLNSRISSNHASLSSDASTLRSQQEALESQIQELTKSQQQQQNDHQNSDSPSSQSNHDVTSPLIPQINFFSPANGAIIIPHLTSPTLARNFFFPVAVAMRMLRINRLLSPPPITALENWLDEGDCWCAASSNSDTTTTTSTSPPSVSNAGQESENEEQSHWDSIRLAVRTSQPIYPTELVLEHFPARGSLEPGTAPRDIELWADFSGLSFEEWGALHIGDLISESPDQSFVPGFAGQKTWARVGRGTYQIWGAEQQENADGNADGYEHETVEINADEAYGSRSRSGGNRRQQGINRGQGLRRDAKGENHVQRFNLDINQNGLLHYTDRFMVRVRSNHGAGHTCLYRVRLHGLPVTQRNRRETTTTNGF